MKKLLIVTFVCVYFTACKKEDTPLQKNVFYELAGPAMYSATITTNSGIETFDSISTGWNWQGMIDVGKNVTMIIRKQSLHDSTTINYYRLYVYGTKNQVIDTSMNDTIYINAKVQ